MSHHQVRHAADPDAQGVDAASGETLPAAKVTVNGADATAVSAGGDCFGLDGCTHQYGAGATAGGSLPVVVTAADHEAARFTVEAPLTESGCGNVPQYRAVKRPPTRSSSAFALEVAAGAGTCK